MKAIIVDDEPLMIKRFKRLSSNIPDLYVVGEYSNPKKALDECQIKAPDIAFIDIEMPVINGLELAQSLRKIRENMVIIFISAHNKYVWDSNRLGADYYIVKPYKEETIKMVMERVRLISARQKKKITIKTFGNFCVLKEGSPVKLTGKAKEILALLVSERGKEISNYYIYSTIWEERPYSNNNMVVYYNAMRRLKKALKDADIEELLISSHLGQMINTEVFNCDFYDWLDKNSNEKSISFATIF